jgi:hypothetical protein
MSPVEKAFALLHAITPKELEDLPPFIRRRFAEQCRNVADMADAAGRMPPVRRSGVLAALQMGERTL